jgi:hypothetical protein
MVALSIRFENLGHLGLAVGFLPIVGAATSKVSVGSEAEFQTETRPAGKTGLTLPGVEHIVNVIDFGVSNTHMSPAADDRKALNIARDFRSHLAS